MAYTKNEKGDAPKMRRGGRRRKKVCVFCGKENNEIDYKGTKRNKRLVWKRGGTAHISGRNIQRVMCFMQYSRNYHAGI